MTCSGCKYLDNENKKEGQVCGCCYYCTKIKSYVNGSNNSCSEYEKSYGRNSYQCNTIYEEGEKYSNDTTPPSMYLFFLIIFIIIAIIANI